MQIFESLNVNGSGTPFRVWNINTNEELVITIGLDSAAQIRETFTPYVFPKIQQNIDQMNEITIKNPQGNRKLVSIEDLGYDANATVETKNKAINMMGNSINRVKRVLISKQENELSILKDMLDDIWVFSEYEYIFNLVENDGRSEMPKDFFSNKVFIFMGKNGGKKVQSYRVV